MVARSSSYSVFATGLGTDDSGGSYSLGIYWQLGPIVLKSFGICTLSGTSLELCPTIALDQESCPATALHFCPELCPKSLREYSPMFQVMYDQLNMIVDEKISRRKDCFGHSILL